MRRLASILALVLGLTLLAAPPASVAVAAHAENRASGSAAGLTTLIGIEPRLSEEAVRENAGLAYDLASDDAVAARAGARATTDVVATRNGLVNVRSTIDRIKAGEKFPHRNDGSVFQNREGLLPKQPQGYYREYVHPTPGVNGPGAQRVIQGQNGELYYSPDHYRTFVPLN
jgi:guanyl-specific ribonuclease Sa